MNQEARITRLEQRMDRLEEITGHWDGLLKGMESTLSLILQEQTRFRKETNSHFERIEADIRALKTGQNELQNGQNELQNGQNELQKGLYELQKGQTK